MHAVILNETFFLCFIPIPPQIYFPVLSLHSLTHCPLAVLLCSDCRCLITVHHLRIPTIYYHESVAETSANPNGRIPVCLSG